MAYTQWILPPIVCPALDGSGVLKIETRIQKSRTPRLNNIVGIWNANTTYNINSGVADVVYYNGVSYPGWQTTITANLNNTPPASLAAWQASPSSYDWKPASNFEFIQSDTSTVFYLDQQIIAQGGLGRLMRSVSRQQGLTTPDARALKFIDYTHYSGHPGNSSTNIGLTDLSTNAARSLVNLIYDDPDAFYTIFFARCTDGGGTHTPPNYSTYRELFNIGDIDFGKLSASYDLDYQPGTANAVQKMASAVPAEAVANRLNQFTVQDLILTIRQQDLDNSGNSTCFIGGQVLLGVDQPPTFPQIGNRYYLDGWTYNGDGSLPQSYDDWYARYGGPSRYYHSRANSRVQGIDIFDPANPNAGQKQNALIIATSSVNDNLHFIKLTTLLSKIYALVNFTWADSNLQSLMTFWGDVVDQTTGVLSSVSVALTNVGFCYEYLFNIDPRCYLGLSGNASQTGAQMNMTGGFTWGTSLADVLKRLSTSLVTYIKSTYDQTNFRAENILADALAPTTNAIPTNWKAGAKGSIKPRVQSALHVDVNNIGYKDSFTCPNTRGSALTVSTGFRAKKGGVLGARTGDSTVDIIQNSDLPAKDQWQTFSPMNGGIIDNGHIVGNYWNGSAWVWSGTIAAGGTPFGGYSVSLTDTYHEFVIVQENTNGVWNGPIGDIYTNLVNYLSPTTNGNSDTVCFWTKNTSGNGPNGGGASPVCLYGGIYLKNGRNEVGVALPYGGQNGQIDFTAIANPTPYVVGYTGFGMDLTICYDPAHLDYVKSVGYDFYNNDALGNSHVGQQIIIPTVGVFTIKSTISSRGVNPSVIQLDRPITTPGASTTNLEFRIGGPTMNPASFVIGTYLYFYDTTHERFGASYYFSDSGTGDSFAPLMFLSTTGGHQGCYTISRMRYKDTAGYDGSTAPDDTYGNALKTFAQCQAALNLGAFQVVARNFVGVLGDVLATGTNGIGNGTTTFVDSTASAFTVGMAGNIIIIGTAIYTIQSYTSASTIILSGTLATGTGLTWKVGGGMNGYGPLDTYSEYSQGAARTYKAQTLAVGERDGQVDVEFLESTNIKPINDTNYPVTNASSGGSGAGGGGGGIGGSGGGGSSATLPSTISITISANTNDLTLVVTNSTWVNVDVTGTYNLTGISGGADGCEATLYNTGTGHLSLPSEDSLSIAGNRFHFPNNSTDTIGPAQAITLHYVGASSRWVFKSRTA